MQIGFIGLGRMGGNMVQQLMEKGHDVIGYDTNKESVESLADAGMMPTESIEDLVSKLDTPKAVWVMVPRAYVQNVLDELVPLLSKGDTIIEGGNTYFEDTVKRAEEITKKGINYLDAGVSGGIDGARNGACIMVGGKKDVFEVYEPLFKDLTVPKGYGYMGKSGAGHYVKMVHNGIEYGMMAAIAEGMNAVKIGKERFGTDLGKAIEVYSNGSIISSSLVTWLGDAWEKDAGLKKLPSEVPYGETEEEMENLEKLAPMKTLETAREMRKSTRDGKESFIGKVVNALRFEFGGHTAKTSTVVKKK